MNGPIAQIVALTCNANAFLNGIEIKEFFPKNSTAKFCDSIVFVEIVKRRIGKQKEVKVADNPNEWFEYIKEKDALLCPRHRNDRRKEKTRVSSRSLPSGCIIGNRSAYS